jgi:hypothetical protein
MNWKEFFKVDWKVVVLYIFIFTIIPYGLQSIFCILTGECPTSMFGFKGITFFLYIIVEIILIALAILTYSKFIKTETKKKIGKKK